MIVRKIQESKTAKGKSLYVVLPKDVCNLKDWNKGDYLAFEEQNGNIIIRKVK